MKFNTPILFLIFNRPDTTQAVFNEIKKIKPKQLFIASDGPRKNNQDDKEKCQKTRKVIDKINWNCEVKTLFRNKNLGCKYAVSSAINWFFNDVEQGIILEDDCVPDQSFFMFCQELLLKYKDNKKIFNISGNNFQNGIQRGNGSYYFSKYFHCWGWATWRDRWNYFDIEMNDFINWEAKSSEIFDSNLEKKYWTRIFKKVYNNKMDSWAYIWSFNTLNNDGLTCLPNINLVRNIGFDENATHTKSNNKLMNLSSLCIKFPLKHPLKAKRNINADKYTSRNLFKIGLRMEIIIFLKKIHLFYIIKKIKDIKL